MKITGVGNSVVDLYYQVPQGFPREQGFIPGGKNHPGWERLDLLRKELAPPLRMAGGSAANTLKLAALLGMEATLVMRTGLDPETQLLEDELQDNFLDLLLDRVHGRTGICCTLREPDGRTTVAAHPGVGVTLTADIIPPGLIEDSDILYLEGYLLQNRPLIEALAQRANQGKTRVVMDLCCPPLLEANRQEIQKLLAKYVDILFMNREEAEALTGHNNPRDALEATRPLAPLAVVKMDKDGALFRDDETITRKSTVELKEVDATGAGDAFVAGFLSGVAADEPLASCCERGHFLSSRIISQVGTRITQEILRDIERAYLSMA